jgi:hypothetical protein
VEYGIEHLPCGKRPMPLFYNKILRFVTFTLIFPLNQVMRDARPEDANSPVAVWLEPLLVVLGVAAVVRFAPMNSPGYFPVVLTLCAIVFVYALVRFCLCPSLAVRWGLVQGGAYWQYENDEATVYGCQFLGWLWGLSLVPIFILQSQVALPHILNPGGYMVWCAVQDFLFFALLQRNLQDKILPVHRVYARDDGYRRGLGLALLSLPLPDFRHVRALAVGACRAGITKQRNRYRRGAIMRA